MRGLKEGEEEAEASLVGLTLRISSPASSSSKEGKDHLLDSSPPSMKKSPFNSLSLASLPSSALVSALKSPHISPRATQPINTTTTHKPQNSSYTPPSALVSALKSPHISPRATQPINTTTTHKPQSSSYTPPSDQYEFFDEPSDRKHKLSSCTPDSAPPRISFSFPVPKRFFAEVYVSLPATIP